MAQVAAKVISDGRIVTSGTPAEAPSFAGKLSGMADMEIAGRDVDWWCRCMHWHKQWTNNFNATTAAHSAFLKIDFSLLQKVIGSAQVSPES